MRLAALFVATAAVLIGSVHAHVEFSAKFRITDDTSMPNAVVEGTMYYFFNSTINAYNHMSRIDYTIPVNMIEILNYSSGTRYKYCGTCYADKYTYDVDNFFYTEGDTPVTSENFGTCKCYTRTTGSVRKYWVRSDNTKILCKAIVTKTTTTTSLTRTITFLTFNTTVPTGTFNIRFSWTCPAPICRRIVDVVMVFDESGSITSSQWKDMIKFAKALVAQFDVDPEAATMGVVFFSTQARIVSYLSANPNAINNALGTSQKGGNTCIGCGITLGIDYVMDKKVAKRPPNPKELLITLTDGANNMPSGGAAKNLSDSIKKIRNRETSTGLTSLAIGVGNGYTDADLKAIASTITGVTTLLKVSNFAELDTIIPAIVTTTCTDLPENECGTNCMGFCSCDTQCVCPKCPEINACFTNNCTVNAQGQSRGCEVKPINCDDNDKCTIDWCDNATGCKHTPVTCDDFNECTDNLCNPNSGCYYTPRDCNMGNLCHAYSCDIKKGCVWRYLCRDDPCRVDKCTPGGCSYESACDDKNSCTNDWCNTTGGNHCQYDVVKKVNCTDGNPCEDDNDCHDAIDLCHLHYCNITRKVCESMPKNFPAPGVCMDNICDDTTGLPIQVPRNCSAKVNDNDPCVVHFCNETLNDCTSRPYCPHYNCKDATCTVIDGIPTCSYSPRVCNNTDKCQTSTCNETSDKCENSAVQCSDGLICTKDDCDSQLGCLFPPLKCPGEDDGNPCILHSCNETVGCYNVTKCEDGIFCTKDVCNLDGSCNFPALKCDLDLTAPDKRCFIDACSEERHCYYTTANTAILDVCGNCITPNDTVEEMWNNSRLRTACVDSMAWPEYVAVLTAAAVAGIVIAAVVVGLIMAVGGFFGTKELIRRSRLAAGMAAQNNPIYQDSGREMTNPAYLGRE